MPGTGQIHAIYCREDQLSPSEGKLLDLVSCHFNFSSRKIHRRHPTLRVFPRSSLARRMVTKWSWRGITGATSLVNFLLDHWLLFLYTNRDVQFVSSAVYMMRESRIKMWHTSELMSHSHQSLLSPLKRSLCNSDSADKVWKAQPFVWF